jgi:hypothetical protein
MANFSTVFAIEKMGGFNGGGGNAIEALFKVRALELSESLLSLNEESKKLLVFDPDALYSSLNETGGFFALCAKNNELKEIRNQNKMAMVFNDRPGTVFLNCNDYNAALWSKTLDLSTDSGAIFILHECLRIMDFAGENNYGYSKNYLKAMRSENLLNSNKLIKAMPEFVESPIKCHVVVERESDHKFMMVYIIYNQKRIFGKKYKYDVWEEATEKFRYSILNQSSISGKTAHQDIITALKKFDCE